jgi:hypothetical protein
LLLNIEEMMRKIDGEKEGRQKRMKEEEEEEEKGTQTMRIENAERGTQTTKINMMEENEGHQKEGWGNQEERRKMRRAMLLVLLKLRRDDAGEGRRRQQQRGEAKSTLTQVSIPPDGQQLLHLMSSRKQHQITQYRAKIGYLSAVHRTIIPTQKQENSIMNGKKRKEKPMEGGAGKRKEGNDKIILRRSAVKNDDAQRSRPSRMMMPTKTTWIKEGDAWWPNIGRFQQTTTGNPEMPSEIHGRHRRRSSSSSGLQSMPPNESPPLPVTSPIRRKPMGESSFLLAKGDEEKRKEHKEFRGKVKWEEANKNNEKMAQKKTPSPQKQKENGSSRSSHRSLASAKNSSQSEHSSGISTTSKGGTTNRGTGNPSSSSSSTSAFTHQSQAHSSATSNSAVSNSHQSSSSGSTESSSRSDKSNGIEQSKSSSKSSSSVTCALMLGVK